MLRLPCRPCEVHWRRSQTQICASRKSAARERPFRVVVFSAILACGVASVQRTRTQPVGLDASGDSSLLTPFVSG